MVGCNGCQENSDTVVFAAKWPQGEVITVKRFQNKSNVKFHCLFLLWRIPVLHAAEMWNPHQDPGLGTGALITTWSQHTDSTGGCG